MTRPPGSAGEAPADAATIDALYAAGGVALDAVPGAGGVLENGFAVLRAGSQSALVVASHDRVTQL